MIRSLKLIGLTMTTALMLSAALASTASAINPQYHSESEFTLLTSALASEAKFTAGAVEVKCKSTHLHGTTIHATTEETSLTPTYKECSWGGLTVDVSFGNCDYLFNLFFNGETSTGASTHIEGPLHIECDAGEAIKLTVTVFASSICTITIPAQTPEGVFDFKTEEASKPRDVLLTSTIKGVHYTIDAKTEICGEPGKTLTNGALDSSVLVRGYVDEEGTAGKQVGIWVQ
jgi:hypothetical protein